MVHVQGTERRKNGSIYFGVLAKCSVIKELRPEVGGREQRRRLPEVAVGEKILAVGFGFEQI